jgi:LacI family transcriptional regulator
VRKLTIIDIAREANVSIKTVSRVINRERGVGSDTRARVEDVIKAHNFKPNASARSLPGSRSYLIGLLIRFMANHYYFNGLQAGVMRACRRHGYHAILETTEDYEACGRDAFVKRLGASQYDGLVVAPPVCDDPEILSVLEEMDIPFVRISPTRQFERAPYVYMDDQRAAYEIVEHLWNLGHRRIAYLGFRDTGASQERYAGYSQFFRDKGLAPPYPQFELDQTTSANALSAGEALVCRPDRPTAVFAATDFLALGLMAAASKHGLRIPDDLSLVGFDDSPGAGSVWPPLTTVHQPIEEIAETAVDLLVAGLGGQLADKTKFARVLDFEVVIRGSTAPPRSQA